MVEGWAGGVHNLFLFQLNHLLVLINFCQSWRVISRDITKENCLNNSSLNIEYDLGMQSRGAWQGGL